MKQQTIDLIKSMTEQGFLVIVDPEKLNNQDGVIIKVMAWKDTDNKAEVTLTACDVKINVEIDELPAFKKEEPKPEIDLLKCDGRRFRAKIEGATCEGIISIEDGLLFLCQNNECGAIAKDKKGFKFSWRVHPPFTADGFENYDVTDFELLPEHRVIFTNCVGEVFTEEDARSGVDAWWIDDDKITCRPIFGITVFSRSAGDTWQIFRSKKSLLKYLYETCD